jgi:hypothetical protein
MKILENYNITKIVSWILVITFLGIVAIERLPGVMVATSNPEESLMFGLFLISFLGFCGSWF